MTITWIEPYPGMDEQGNKVDVAVQCSCSREDAIRIARHGVAKWGKVVTDSGLLQHFMVVHFATVEGDEHEKAT